MHRWVVVKISICKLAVPVVIDRFVEPESIVQELAQGVAGS